MKNQLKKGTKNSGAKQKVQHGMALKPPSSPSSCPFKSREVLLNHPTLTLFSSDIEMGKGLLGRNRENTGTTEKREHLEKLPTYTLKQKTKHQPIPTPGEMSIHPSTEWSEP